MGSFQSQGGFIIACALLQLGCDDPQRHLYREWALKRGNMGLHPLGAWKMFYKCSYLSGVWVILSRCSENAEDFSLICVPCSGNMKSEPSKFNTNLEIQSSIQELMTLSSTTATSIASQRVCLK